MQIHPDPDAVAVRADARADDRVALLDDHASKWAARPRRRLRIQHELEQLLTREYIDLLAWIASKGGSPDAHDLLTDGVLTDGADVEWSATLGYLLSRHDESPELAANLLSGAIRRLPDGDARRLYGLELIARCLQDGRHEDAVDAHGVIRHSLTAADTWVLCDLAQSASAQGLDSEPSWSDSWVEFFAQWDLNAPVVSEGEHPVLLTLSAPECRQAIGDSPLVTVVLEAHPGESDTLRWSLDSLRAQTWQNLQILVIHSDENLRRVVDAASQEDDRVAGLSVSKGASWDSREERVLAHITGDFVTWSRASWWSHPERVTRQMAALQEGHASTVAVGMLSAADDLVFSHTRETGTIVSPGTALMRAVDLRDIGGRQNLSDIAVEDAGARVHLARGTEGATLPSPLVIARSGGGRRPRHCQPDSIALARRDMLSLCDSWRRSVEAQETGWTVPAGDASLSVPRWNADEPRHIVCDVLVAGDWRSFGGPQKSMIEEIEAYRSAGFSVAIMHVHPSRFIGLGSDELCEAARDLVLRGRVTLAHHRDRVRANTTFLRYPPTLAYGAPALDVIQEHLVIVANQAPSERDGTDVRYRVEDVRRHAEVAFGMRAVWAPQGPQVREALVGRVPDGELLDFDLPGILDVDGWAQDRRRRRARRPVVGRHSRDNAMKWPSDPAELLTIYPDGSDIDVRVMGGAKAVGKILGGDVPPRWLVFEADEMPVRDFLNSLDFFVYFQHPEAYDAFGRAMLEALATGVVAILPHRMEPVFGDAAIYAAPAEVIAIVRDLFDHPSKYRRQSERALAYVRTNFSYEAHLARVERIRQG